MKHLLLFAPLALAGCATLFGPRSPFAVDRKGDTVEFNYAWSAEASAIPALVRRLRSDLETAWRAASTTAATDRAEALAMKRPFNGRKFTRQWTTAGQTSRLLSLDAQTFINPGNGTSPSTGAEALLWDRSARREVKAETLFVASKDLGTLVHTPYCTRHEDQRTARPRVIGAPDPYAECPRLDELAVVPTDSNGNRRFERFRLIAPSGVFGRAHVEGRYEISVPVTPALRAALKPAYRSSFEVQPQ